MTTSPFPAEPRRSVPAGPTPAGHHDVGSLAPIALAGRASHRAGEARSDQRRSGGDVPSAPPSSWVNEGVHTACRPSVRRLYEQGLSSLAVTSSRRGEGRSTVALGVALVNRSDYVRPTVLLELDFDAPALASRLGLAPRPGLAEVLRGEVSVEDAIAWHDASFGVLLAGEVTDAAELTSAFVRSDILAELRSRGRLTIADLPPLPPQGRADRVAEHFDDVLLVVQAGITPLAVVRTAVNSLPLAPDVVLNHIEPPVTRWLHRRKKSV